MAEYYVGEIRLFAGNYAPEGWLPCDGRKLPINGNEQLYSLIGSTYGGDGSTYFNLPELRGRLPMGRGTDPTTGMQLSLAQQIGEENVRLSENHLPNHNHSFNTSQVDGVSNTPAQRYFNIGGKNAFNNTTNPDNIVQFNQVAIGFAGGNTPHENRMPFMAMNYIIANSGYYPSPD